MIKKIYNLLSAALFLTIFSCGGGGGDEGGPEPIPIAQPPEAASLVFPENNTECNISEILSDTQSTVPFEWNASENTDTYQINVTNLNTNQMVISTIVSIPEANITLERGTPYEWSVISRADGTNTTATSESFRFFNEGPGIENFAPFPAEAINPNRGENLDASTTSISLEWETIDIDGDAINFEIFFGIEETPSNLLTTSDVPMAETQVMSDQTYFWRIISIDEIGNSSQSEIFQFRVN